MMVFLRLLGLKFRSFSGRPLLLIFLLLSPLPLIYLSGVSETANDASLLRPAYVDLAANEDSRAFTAQLRKGPLPWVETSEAEGRAALRRSEADALLTIPADFKLIHGGRNLKLLLERHPEAAGVISEETTAALIPLVIRKMMLQNLLQLGQNHGFDRERLLRDFQSALEEEKAGGERLQFVFKGRAEGRRRLLYLPDYRIEILFLSIFALLGSFILPAKAMRRRLLSHSGAFFLDYAAALLCLFLTGLTQLLLMRGATLLFFGDKVHLGRMDVFAVFLLIQLSISQCLYLLRAEGRLTISALVLLFSALFGGCFFPMPSAWLHQYGRFTPHGWAMASLSGVPLISPQALLPFCFFVFILAAFLQIYQLRREN